MCIIPVTFPNQILCRDCNNDRQRCVQSTLQNKQAPFMRGNRNLASNPLDASNIGDGSGLDRLRPRVCAFIASDRFSWSLVTKRALKQCRQTRTCSRSFLRMTGQVHSLSNDITDRFMVCTNKDKFTLRDEYVLRRKGNKGIDGTLTAASTRLVACSGCFWVRNLISCRSLAWLSGKLSDFER